MKEKKEFTHLLQYVTDPKTGLIHAHLKELEKDLGYFGSDFRCDFGDRYAQLELNASDTLSNSMLPLSEEEWEVIEETGNYNFPKSKLLNLSE